MPLSDKSAPTAHQKRKLRVDYSAPSAITTPVIQYCVPSRVTVEFTPSRPTSPGSPLGEPHEASGNRAGIAVVGAGLRSVSDLSERSEGPCRRECDRLRGRCEHSLCSEQPWKAHVHQPRQSLSKPNLHNLDLGHDRAKFGRPDQTYSGKHVCVTGRITLYRGTTETIVSEPFQVKVR